MPKKNAKQRPRSKPPASAKFPARNAGSGDDFRRHGDLLSDVESLSYMRGRTSMSTKTTKFLTEWLRWHVVGRVASAEDIPALAAKCLHDAWHEGIPRYDIEAAVGPVEECIRQALIQSKK
jgi:hypothetical protein